MQGTNKWQNTALPLESAMAELDYSAAPKVLHNNPQSGILVDCGCTLTASAQLLEVKQTGLHVRHRSTTWGCAYNTCKLSTMKQRKALCYGRRHFQRSCAVAGHCGNAGFLSSLSLVFCSSGKQYQTCVNAENLPAGFCSCWRYFGGSCMKPLRPLGAEHREMRMRDRSWD